MNNESCRTDDPNYHIDETQLPELTEKEINDKAEEWFTWANPDYNSRIILGCAIDSLTSEVIHPEWESMFEQLMNNIDKLPVLKKEMMEYIKTDIEAGNI